MISYDCLPCSLQTFTIGEQSADTSDFGNGGDEGPDEGQEPEPYACSHWTWHRTNKSVEMRDAREKYKLSDEDFDKICDELEDILHVGSCGWCV